MHLRNAYKTATVYGFKRPGKRPIPRSQWFPPRSRGMAPGHVVQFIVNGRQNAETCFSFSSSRLFPSARCPKIFGADLFCLMGGGRPNRAHQGRRAETIIFGSLKHLGVKLRSMSCTHLHGITHLLQRFKQSERFRGGEPLSCEREHRFAFRQLEPLRDRGSDLVYVSLLLSGHLSRSEISRWGSKAMSCDLQEIHVRSPKSFQSRAVLPHCLMLLL